MERGDVLGVEMEGSRMGRPSVLTTCLPSPSSFSIKEKKYIYNIDSSDFQDFSPSLSPLKTVIDGGGV